MSRNVPPLAWSAAPEERPIGAVDVGAVDVGLQDYIALLGLLRAMSWCTALWLECKRAVHPQTPTVASLHLAKL